ncbi:MAG: DUF2497 domain-containing protein [Holosporales bacterium]
MTAQKSGTQEKSVEEILNSIREIISSDVSEAEQQGAAKTAAGSMDAQEDVLELTPAMEEAMTLENQVQSAAPSSESVQDVDASTEVVDKALEIEAKAESEPSDLDKSSSEDAVILEESLAPAEIESAIDTSSVQALEAVDQPSQTMDEFTQAPAAPVTNGQAASSAPSAPVGFADLLNMKMDAQPQLTPEDRKPMLDQATVSETVAAFSSLKEALTQFEQKKEHLVATGEFSKMTIEQVVREMLRPMLKEWLDAHLPSLVKWLVAEQIEKMLQEQGIASPKE